LTTLLRRYAPAPSLTAPVPENLVDEDSAGPGRHQDAGSRLKGDD